MINIEKMLVPNYGTRGTHKPIAIVDHITIGKRGSVINTFMNPGGNSSHYLVCRDGAILQFVDLTNRAHTNGIVNTPKSPLVRQMGGINANYYTATIEHEGYLGNGIDGELTEAQFYASCWLHKWIQTEVIRIYGNTISLNSHQVIAHNQIDSKKGTCPGVNFPWTRLYAELSIADSMDIEHYEERLQSLQGEGSKRAVAYAIAERVRDLGNKLNDPKWGSNAATKLSWLYPVMDIVGGEKTPTGAYNRVMELYKTAMGNGQYSPEGIRKLLLFEPLMKERGLL
ncbi:hypothetical protein PAECIP111893_02368 [Paenibacillus plantiphilus]|uniref:N-acetylmuramoyl-L-alanine amidase n=1 Tax=Paenibacillus plantiphilus TaxID=2905650 RepID=A0ABM9C6R9_9BACL|nr:N-acetylmuramoyl-L-alanine amidase [Paenibacillus plantiphilus]CAH1205545.1 hypothetical protein PAECIP111893_02368 [Paenibacillus plantiphilus]